MNGNGIGRPRVPHSEQHGYIPPGNLFFDFDAYGRPAPPGYAFNMDGDLVQLPYEPWSEGPQMAWEDPQNFDYLQYAAGKALIENHPSADPRIPARYSKGAAPDVGHVAPITHEHVALVTEDAYLAKDGDAVPHQDEGTGSQAVFDMPASVARTRYRLSKGVVGYVQVEPPTDGQSSPLNVAPSGTAQGGPAVAPFGGAVALARFQFGHLGSQIASIICDVLPGETVRLSTASSFMRVTGRIAPKYFAHTDAGPLPTVIRSYLLFPGGPALDNDNFTDLPNNIMSLQGGAPGTIVAANAQALPVQYQGWCAFGYLGGTSVLEVQPRRVFNGTVPSAAPGAPFTNQSIVPIPRGAVSARVIGGFFTPALNTNIPVQWVQNLDWLGAVTGPFGENLEEPITILPGAKSISVFGGSDLVAAGNTEIPFSVVFYLDV
ncbi:MAG TPA: hypothetical protein VMI75_01600 [Polyangiaceae bacterium]|nr:hypothetical protein [Polyangiaceae bacterium]